MNCPFCNKPVEPGQTLRQEVIGWEKDRKKGGTNALELRKRTGRTAHSRCVDRAKHVPPDQPDLFE